MSWQLKFLLVFTVVVMGTVLYLKRQPAMDFAMATIPHNKSPVEGAAASSYNEGQTANELWKAIAPCWNRLANASTLPTRLELSFDDWGELAAPPEIERDPNAPITDQSLQSEALALQAVGQCGVYPMARGQHGIMVLFPTPEQLPVDAIGTQRTMVVTQH